MNYHKIVTTATCFTLLAYLLIGDNLTSLPSIRAQETATQSAQPATESATENIKKRLQKVLSQQAKSPTSSPKAWFGQIKDIANSTLTLNTLNGSKLASISAQAKILRSPGSQTITAQDIAIGDFAIAMGLLNGNQVLNTKRLVVTSKFEPSPPRIVFLASIVEINKKSLTVIKLTDQTEFTLTISSKTELTKKEENEIKEAEIEDFNQENIVLIIAQLEETEATDTQEISSLLHLHLL